MIGVVGGALVPSLGLLFQEADLPPVLVVCHQSAWLKEQVGRCDQEASGHLSRPCRGHG